MDSLHTAVFDLYGYDACQTFLSQVIDNPFATETEIVTAFGPWNWEMDERSNLIENTYTVIITRSVSSGASEQKEVHLALRDDGSLGWFTDCGEPLP